MDDKYLSIVAVAPLEESEVVGYILPIILTYHVVTQLFFKTQLGQRVKNRFIRQFNDSESDE